MKLFWKKLALLAIIFMCITVIPAYCIDPFNVFHWRNVRLNGLEPNKNYIKTKYLLSVPRKYNALMFGSSRVGAIHVEHIHDVNTYNMTYSSGIPTEHKQNLETLLKAGIKLKRIYVGVDEILLLVGEEKHRKHRTCSYEYLKNNPAYFFKLYTNPFIALKSLFFYKKGTDTTGLKQMYTYGWSTDYGYKSVYDWSKEKEIKRTFEDKSVIRERYEKIALQDLKEMVRLCKQHDVEIVVFTNPIYKTEYIKALNVGYLNFLRELSNITGFYNFSGLNFVTTDKNNFRDPSHYKAEVGDLIINAITSGNNYEATNKDGFGWYVTDKNVEKLINAIDVK